MAYAFPGTEASHVQGQGQVSASSSKNSRKGSEDAFDVLKEFKYKIDEDENYIEFFQERIRIEEGYVKQLQKLYDRTVAIDTLHDDQLGQRGKTSARKGWIEVRDYTSREIDSRQALMLALKSSIIPDLAKIKDEQERIRSGLRENVRISNEMYDEHFKTHVPRLKKTYWQKCQALEEHKRQEAAILAQARLLSTPSPSSPSGSPQHEYPQPTFGAATPNNASGTSLPHITVGSNPPSAGGLADTPYFSPPRSSHTALPSHTERHSERSGSISFGHHSASHGRKESHSARTRDRAGSLTGGAMGEKKDTKEVFQDLAVQGKKGFNAFMQKLGGDKGDREKDETGFSVVGAGGKEDDASDLQRRSTNKGYGKGQESGALRAVRAKRELDDADKAYRNGVFHLESLRLRREKVQASALTNLEQFNDDLTIKLQRALATYVDIVHATAATNAQATDVSRQAVAKIDLGRDMSLFRTRLMAYKGVESTAVPYENFYVGPCKSLIFGISLTDYDFARGEGGDHGRPPTVVEKCLSALDQNGLDVEGLYRISGRKAGLQKMIQDIELDEEKFEFEDIGDVHSIANVLKQYLRELPEPVFLLPHSERVKITENRENLIHSNFGALRSRMRRLPPIHQTTFQAIIEHLGRVQSRSSLNKMGAKNLAVIFNSVLFGADIGPEATALTLHHQADTVLEDIITFSDLLFSADFEPMRTPPINDRSGITTEQSIRDGPNLGSAHTKLKIIEAPAGGGSKTPIGSDGAAGDIAAGDKLGSMWMAANEVELASVKTDFTPDSDLDLLYDPTVIPALFRESVGSEYHVRPLASTDLLRSHFALLSDLATSPPIAPSLYASIFKNLRSTPGIYYITVIVDKTDDQLVAAATLFVERKHIHAGGSAGHIEEVVVSARTQGKGLGLKLVRGLKEMGEQLGCYKIILDCNEKKVGFYEKCGFKRRGVQMSYYSESRDKSPMFAPSLPFPNSNIGSRQGSSLALPELRGPPLPPRPAEQEGLNLVVPIPTSPPRGGSQSDSTSASSPESRVTYTYPIASDLAQTAAGTAGDAWPLARGNSGSGSSAPTPRRSQSPVRPRISSIPRTGSPLPPGAAAPYFADETERPR